MNITKNKWFQLLAVTAIAVAAILLLRWAVQPKPQMDAVKTEDAYQLDCAAWTGKDEHTLTLNAGDTLHVEWIIQAGSMDIQIAIPGQKPIYTANHITFDYDKHAAFDITIPEAGAYTVSLTAKNAAGTFSVT